jgi:hypothetical protein
MCCEHDNHHGGGHEGPHLGGPCGCGEHANIGPCFWTKMEKIAYLEEYLADLQTEVKSVEERVAALKGEE